jgi:Ca2+-transporting ATPase
MHWYQMTHENVARLLQTGPSGLSTTVAGQRLDVYGTNVFSDLNRISVWKLLVSQFADRMVLVLVLAAIVSAVLGDWTDMAIILAILLINAAVGFLQSYRAERALAAIRQLAVGKARVMRNNLVLEIPEGDLVPGDVVVLEAGDVVPADLRFFQTFQLYIDESALTGESVNVVKQCELRFSGEVALPDRLNMGFRGTHVTRGRGLAYVTETGMDTEMGKIAGLLQVPDPPTPLQRSMSVFGNRLSLLIGLVCLIIFIAGWLSGEQPLKMLLISIALAVAVIPEALPSLIIVSLALGARRLAQRNVLVRKLAAVESLGAVTCICMDKTGTLTRNEMHVQQVVSPPLQLPGMPELQLLAAMALSNDVVAGEWGGLIGDSMERAMVDHAASSGYGKASLLERYPRVAEIPFDAGRRCMTTLHAAAGGLLVISKGAPEAMHEKLSETHQAIYRDYAGQLIALLKRGCRVLCFAVRWIPSLPETGAGSGLESDMQFAGLVGLADSVRAESAEVISHCVASGIRPVMITGDHPETALAVAASAGIISAGNGRSTSGTELNRLDDSSLRVLVADCRVFARVDPAQKLRIIHALQANGETVAMVGDGVNDAPALKHADIGVAMGGRGTAVAKESARLIVLDDDLGTLVEGIREGRRIFDNILRFIKYIMAGNFGELLALLLPLIVGLPIPLMAIHILWINLVTDGLTGLALAFEQPQPGILERPPRKSRRIFSETSIWAHIAWVGALMGTLSLLVQYRAYQSGNIRGTTMVFALLCLCQLFHVLAIRPVGRFFSAGWWSANFSVLLAVSVSILLLTLIIYAPSLNALFQLKPLRPKELLLVVSAASLVFWAVKLERYLLRRFGRTDAGKTVPSK